MHAIDGGWTHRLWRLNTSDGAFAVKQFLHEDRWPLSRLQRAARYELDLWKVGLVSMPRPRHAIDGRLIVEDALLVDGSAGCVRLHSWVDGSQVPGGVACSPELARDVGAILHKLHSNGQRLDPENSTPAGMLTESHAWARLAERLAASADAEPSWARRFRALQPFLEDVQQVAAAATNGPIVVSHRDVNQTNCLMDRRGVLTLVDWDKAGPTPAAHDLGGACLEWAGAGRGQPDLTVVRALCNGYRDSGGTITTEIGPLLASWVAGSGCWMQRNAEIVVAAQHVDRIRLKRARFQLGESIVKLERAQRSWVQWLREFR